MYTACCASGYYKYIDEFYENTRFCDPNIVNMQIRYWIEAVEKFYNISEEEYDEEIIEEGILIINCLANSLMILGGVNWNGKGPVPSLLNLYDGEPFPLKEKNQKLYNDLIEINNLYNKLSKHFCKDRVELYRSISYSNLKKFFNTSRDIWLWVCHNIFKTNEFDTFFHEPIYLTTNEE